MAIGWNALTITPRNEAIEELKREWSWLLPEKYQPVLFSALGDMFYEVPAGEIWWLNTGTAELSKVAERRDAFVDLLDTDILMNWFLPPPIEKLRAAGKVLGEGQCYSFLTLPVFKEGKYTAENLFQVDAREHFELTGSIHRQIRALPDGSKVKMTWRGG
jgi:Domain of unknown function (DUF1851)